jgi:antitoxin PrlF
MKSVVSEKGQVTIPKPLRERLGIKAGQVLDFREEEGTLVARKTKGEDPIKSVYGILKTKRRTDQIIETLRGPAEK